MNQRTLRMFKRDILRIRDGKHVRSEIRQVINYLDEQFGLIYILWLLDNDPNEFDELTSKVYVQLRVEEGKY